jgi:hypothetical protein
MAVYCIDVAVRLMSIFKELNKLTIQAINNGHCGIFTASDLSMMLNREDNKAFRAILTKSVSNDTLKRITKSIYVNAHLAPNPKGAIYRIAKQLRWKYFNYVSLESQLSHLGVISQIPMAYLSVMTTGRSGHFITDYGTIEFTHTNRDISLLADGVYFDDETGMFRASKERAITDLKRVGRNINMIEEIDDVE